MSAQNGHHTGNSSLARSHAVRSNIKLTLITLLAALLFALLFAALTLYAVLENDLWLGIALGAGGLDVFDLIVIYRFKR